MRVRAFSVLALTLVLGAVVAGAQEGPIFEETTEVVLVEIPVNVVKDNQAVRGLTAADFEAFADDTPIELSGFEVIDLALFQEVPRAEEEVREKKVPITGRRHFLLLFDLSFTRPDVLVVAVETARDLVQSGLHPTDLVGVAVSSASYGVDVLLGFTPDQRQVGKVLDGLDRLLNRDVADLHGARPGSQGDALRLAAGDFPALAAQLARFSGRQLTTAAETMEWISEGRSYGALLQFEYLLEMDKDQTEVLLERQRTAVERLSTSLGDLAKLTAGIEGRKFLIYFSEGFDSSVISLGENIRRGSFSYRAPMPDALSGGRSVGGGSRALRYLNEMIEQFRRAGWTIHSVDPGGLRHDDEDWRFRNEDSLTMIAKDTGGEYYGNFNDLGAAMEGMLDKTSVTYVLSFHAAGIEPDGSFHPVRVKLRKGHPGARVLHPPGYFAPKPLAEQGPLESAMLTGELIVRGEPGGELEAGVLVASFKSPAEEARVTVWVEADGPRLLAGHEGERLEVELFGYALGADRQIHGFFSQTVSLDLGKARKKLARGSLKLLNDLALRPGRYDLRVLVRATQSGRYALRVMPLSVPDLTAADLVLLPPLILDDPRRSVVFRQSGPGRSPEQEEARYPFKIGKSQFVPAVRPVLAGDQLARICVMAYHLDAAQMLFSAGVVASDGTRVERERLAMVGKSETTADGLDQLILDFDPRGLEPGEYTLRVGIADQVTGATYAQSASFRVEG